MTGLLAGFCCAPAADAAGSIEKIFGQANSFYRQGKYAEAAAAYEAMLSRGIESGNLYFNLGNSYCKQGKQGLAVLNYERAQRFIPRDSDLRSNYEYARSLLNLPKQNLAGGKIAGWIDGFWAPVSMNGLAILLSVFSAAFLVLVFVKVFFKDYGRRWVNLLLALSILVFLSGAYSLFRKADYIRTAAVVTVGEAEVRFAPLEGSTTYFSVTEGSLVKVTQESAGWYKIKRSDGKGGWVDKNTVTLVFP